MIFTNLYWLCNTDAWEGGYIDDCGNEAFGLNLAALSCRAWSPTLDKNAEMKNQIIMIVERFNHYLLVEHQPQEQLFKVLKALEGKEVCTSMRIVTSKR